MKFSGTMPSLPDTSLRKSRSANIFALRWMEEQQRREIGKRLWELRENGPHTNRSIGDAVGVSERTVAEWVAGRQGITYDHAKKVGELFAVDIDWLWRGREQGPTPDPFATESTEAVDELREVVEQLADRQAELLSKLDAVLAEQERQRQLQEPGEQTQGGSGT